jgi:hypothetical protein
MATRSFSRSIITTLTLTHHSGDPADPTVTRRVITVFEWLQRPENALAGHIRWPDYRGRDAPTAIRIFHHKTGAVVLHPVQDSDGTLFYADAEDVLSKVPRRGIPIVLHETRDKTEPGQPQPAKLYSENGMATLVRRLRDEAGLPATFTLDACRNGGMTELEEAELRMVKAAHFPLTRAAPTKATPSAPWTARLRQRENGMPIALRPRRTPREQNFGMTRRSNFGMTEKNQRDRFQLSVK